MTTKLLTLLLVLSLLVSFLGVHTAYAALPAPTHVRASDGTYTTKVLVTWSAVTGGTSYKVYRAVTATGTKSLRGTTTLRSFSDTTAAPNVTYYYWVIAYKGTGHSAYSAFNTGWRSVVAPPAGVKATDGKFTGKVQVSWKASVGATSYKVYRATSASGTKSLRATVTTLAYNDTTLLPSTMYYYWIVAYKSTSKSGYSAPDSGWRTIAHVPEAWTGAPVSSVPVDLVNACKAEGVITIIATPDDWANYGQILADFIATTGAAINSINPLAGSADELAAIEANLGNKGPGAPVVVDIGYAYAALGVANGDFQAYQVQTWSAITDPLLGIASKEPSGLWTGGYYGVIAFETNTDVAVAPANWSNLLGATYASKIALRGDPTTSNQAQQSVYAAALGNGGSLDNAQPGLDFFQSLKTAGNFASENGSITNTSTPVLLGWDYLAYGERDSLAGTENVVVTYPSATIASMYVQAISKYAPHPNCAKVWMEILHSDEGQLAWMEGYTHVSNQADMESRHVIPQALLDKLPPPSAYAGAVFPTPEQLATARALIATGWPLLTP